MGLAKVGKGHTIIGSILAGLALLSAFFGLVLNTPGFGFLVFFFGIWGGIEIGRVVESKFREIKTNQEG